MTGSPAGRFIAAATACLVLGILNAHPSSGAVRADDADWPGAYTTVSGPACPGGVRWHMVMLEYSSNSGGGTLSRDPAVVAGYKKYLQFSADTVAEASACAVTWDVDVVDMGDRVYGSAASAYPPSDAVSAYKTRGYDTVMFRYPDNGDGAAFVGRTDSTNWIQFPAGGSHDETIFPWTTVLIHEWLHGAVARLDGRGEQGMPSDDVHHSIGRSEPYATILATKGGYAASMALLTDLIAGRVPFEGRNVGFTRNDWLMLGTPSPTVPLPPEVRLEVSPRIVKGWSAFAVVSRSTEPVSVRIDGPGRRNDRTMTVVPTEVEGGTEARASARFRSLKGVWRVCATQPADAANRWVAGETCERVRLR